LLRPALLGAATVLWASTGFAPAAATGLHLELDKSAPEAGAVLAESPSSVTLWFTQAPQMAGTSVRLVSGGEPLDLGDAVASEDDPKIIVLAISEPLADGEYTVVWRAMAADGHVVRGDFPFTVRAAP
ncbi:MAG: copper resistance protein CopC, partial [Gemmatimonadota bacterium]|nr:copper resistance protein CopC [Gemmatimonadota bacterium]